MKIKIFILLSLIITIPIFSQDKYEYDTKIEITGKIITELFYGPPGFGEDIKHDKKVYPFLILLENDIIINGNTEFPDEKIRKIQLSFPYNQKENIKKFKNKTVKITGKFFHSDNGNHYTNVLIDVEKIIPIM